MATFPGTQATLRPINRNTVYRIRNLKIEFPISSVQFPPMELTEVNSISFDSSAPTSVFTGPIRAIIQPWYFGPFVIKVSGKSYIGAYRQEDFNVSVDADIVKLRKLRDLCNEQYEDAG